MANDFYQLIKSTCIFHFQRNDEILLIVIKIITLQCNTFTEKKLRTK